MAAVTLTGNGKIDTAVDFHTVKWTGATKGGKSCEITLTNAINLGDIEWTFAEKNDTVPAVTFTACYTGTEASTVEPWEVKLEDGLTAGTDEILLGAGVFSIDGNAVALTRGGGSFKTTREYRRINADGDRGAVKDRIVCEGSEATLTMNVLQFLTKVASLYPCITTT